MVNIFSSSIVLNSSATSDKLSVSFIFSASAIILLIKYLSLIFLTIVDVVARTFGAFRSGPDIVVAFPKT